MVLDNLSCHKRARGRELIEGVSCTLLLLPPYSLDLNPIELAFAKLKALLRKAGQRTVEGLWGFLGQALGALSPKKFQNHFLQPRPRTPATALPARSNPPAASCWCPALAR